MNWGSGNGEEGANARTVGSGVGISGGGVNFTSDRRASLILCGTVQSPSMRLVLLGREQTGLYARSITQELLQTRCHHSAVHL
jgi:hypothetical protein